MCQDFNPLSLCRYRADLTKVKKMRKREKFYMKLVYVLTEFTLKLSFH